MSMNIKDVANLVQVNGKNDEKGSEKPSGQNEVEDWLGPKTEFRQNCKGLKLHCSYWIPQNEKIRGLVYLCHGFAEHLQWYEKLALQFNDVGILAFGHDHVGHGQSEGVRGDVRSIDEYIVDMSNHCEQIKKRYDDMPLYVVAHSMGGMIAIRTAQCRPKLFAGLVLVGPLIQPDKNEATTFRIAVAKVLASAAPLLQVVKLKLSHVTRDSVMQEKLSKDPLRYHGGIRARWAYNIHNELIQLLANMDSVLWPFLILHGQNDHLCDPGAAQDFFDEAKVKDKSFKLFPSAYHHLFLELPEVRQEAMNDTVNWIEKRLKNGNSSKSPPLQSKAENGKSDPV